MTETVSGVFDVAYPSPATLQDISSITFVAELWRNGIRSYLERDGRFDFCFFDYASIQLKRSLPDLPRKIYEKLLEYATTSGNSISEWLNYHRLGMYTSPFAILYYCLSVFHDFAWDWNNGTIHYVRTAKRMMLCDEVCNVQKFRIACLYCFEDDIKRIWPSVTRMLRVYGFDSTEFPLLRYWICNLKNEPFEVQVRTGNLENKSIDEMMLDACGSNNYTCAEYFWNRMLRERKSHIPINLCISAWELFARYILQRLSEPQLEQFLVGRDDANLLRLLVIYSNTAAKQLVLPTWKYIGNKMHKDTFAILIEALLWAENYYFVRRKWHPRASAVYLGCKIWKSAAENLKNAALGSVLPEASWFDRTKRSSTDREMRLTITILSDASFKQRNTFWHRHWAILILGANVEDVLEIMKLCFSDHNEIDSFKEHMFKYENIKPYLLFMLKRCCVEEANKFLAFCNSDAQKRMELKQRFLELNWHDADDCPCFLCINFFSEDERVNKFINDAGVSEVDIDKLSSINVTEGC